MATFDDFLFEDISRELFGNQFLTDEMRDVVLQVMESTQTEGFRQQEFGESTRRFDIQQTARQALLDSIGLGEDGGGFGDLLGGGGGESAGFSALLQEQRDVQSQLLEGIEGFGSGQRSRINQGFDAAIGSEIANFEQRGLGASSLRSGAVGSIEGQRQQGLLDLEDSLIGQRTDLIRGTSQDITGTQTEEINRQLQRQLQAITTGGQIASSLL